jgi:hypothetical protein
MNFESLTRFYPQSRGPTQIQRSALFDLTCRANCVSERIWSGMILAAVAQSAVGSPTVFGVSTAVNLQPYCDPTAEKRALNCQARIWIAADAEVTRRVRALWNHLRASYRERTGAGEYRQDWRACGLKRRTWAARTSLLQLRPSGSHPSGAVRDFRDAP